MPEILSKVMFVREEDLEKDSKSWFWICLKVDVYTYFFSFIFLAWMVSPSVPSQRAQKLPCMAGETGEARQGPGQGFSGSWRSYCSTIALQSQPWQDKDKRKKRRQVHLRTRSLFSLFSPLSNKTSLTF